jgi:hypothetical protein
LYLSGSPVSATPAPELGLIAAVDHALLGVNAPVQASLLGGSTLSGGPLSGGGMAPLPEYLPISPVTTPGDGVYNAGGHYGPTVLKLASGTVLLFSGLRDFVDSSSFGIGVRRSFDNGVSWTSEVSPFADGTRTQSILFGGAIQDAMTGEVFSFYQVGVTSINYVSSKDDGLTWSAPIDITASVRQPGWSFYATGPAHGIQLVNGNHAGRLIMPADHRYTANTSGVSWSHLIYSDDHGVSWHIGANLESFGNLAGNSNECTLVVLNNGDLEISFRVVGTGSSISGATRGYAISSDGGDTFRSFAPDFRLAVPSVSTSLLRVNANLILFCGPYAPSGGRRDMAIWASTDETATWHLLKVIDYRVVAYSDMALLDANTILIAYNVATTGLNTFTRSIMARRIDLNWLMDGKPDEFNWYFNEQAPGTPAETAGPTIYDYSFWQNHAQAVTTDIPPQYIAGRNGESALSLGAGSGFVKLTVPTIDIAGQTGNGSMALDTNDDLTVQITMRTTAANGVILGSFAANLGWGLKVVNGKVRFQLQTTNTDNFPQTIVSVTSASSVNDGNWHNIVAIRDTHTRLLKVYVDGVLQLAPESQVLATNHYFTVSLGAYTDGTERLGMDVDQLRITRGIVDPLNFIPANYTKPQMPIFAAPTNAITSASGLQFWLPDFSDGRFYADTTHSLPAVTPPAVTNGIGSGYDNSANHFSLLSNNIQYGYDSVMGQYWPLGPTSSSWQVGNSHGTSAHNFDFVQNTGVYTISTMVRADQAGVILDTDTGTAGNPGFSLWVASDKSLNFSITDGQIARYSNTIFNNFDFGHWYQIVIVGRGVGQPVTFYVTPITASSVHDLGLASPLGGADGIYPTDANHDLTIGNRTDMNSQLVGRIIDTAIYNRALSSSEVQQIFNFEHKSVPPAPSPPLVLPLLTNILEDQNTNLIHFYPAAADIGVVQYFYVPSPTNGTAFFADGLTPIPPNSFITVAQGQAGLIFHPDLNNVLDGHLTVLSYISNSISSVGSGPIYSTIKIQPVNDPPTASFLGDLTVLEDSGPHIAPLWMIQVSPGPFDESSQTVTFTVTTDTPEKFSVLPTVSPVGTLSYTSAPDAVGAAHVRVTLHDSGGTAFGGSDTSIYNFNINLTPVNDPPSFVIPEQLITGVNQPFQTVANFARSLSTGPPDESGQLLNFIVNTDNSAMFSVQPQISPDGTLTYQVAPNAKGAVRFSVVLHDNGGTANGGNDTSLPSVFYLLVGSVWSLGAADGLTSGDDVVRVARVGSMVSVQINGGTPQLRETVDVPAMTIDTMAGNDTVILDFAQGNPIADGGLTFIGGTGVDGVSMVNSTGLAMSLFGSPTAMDVAQGSVGGKPIRFSGVDALDVNGLADFSLQSSQSGNAISLDNLSGKTRVNISGSSFLLTLAAVTHFTFDTTDAGAANGNDTLSINASGLAGVGSVSFLGASGHDQINVNGAQAPLSFVTTNPIGISIQNGSITTSSPATITTLTLQSGVLHSGANLSVGNLVFGGNSQLDVAVGTQVTLNSLDPIVGSSPVITKQGSGAIVVSPATSTAKAYTFTASAGAISINQDLGTGAVFNTATNVTLNVSQHIAAMNVLANGRVTLSVGRNKLLRANSITVDPTGFFDITDNFVVVSYAGQPANTDPNGFANSYIALVKRSNHGLLWNVVGGLGTSSVTGAGKFKNGTMSVGLNSPDGAQSFDLHPLLIQEPVSANDLLISYLKIGDADMSETLDGSDYAIVDYGYANHLSGWFQGDFNMDGVVNGLDYAILDNAFNFQYYNSGGGLAGTQLTPLSLVMGGATTAASSPTQEAAAALSIIQLDHAQTLIDEAVVAILANSSLNKK